MRIIDKFAINHEYDDDEYTFVRRWVRGCPISAYLLKRGTQIKHCHINQCGGVCTMTPLQLFGKHVYMGKNPNRVVNQSLYESEDALMLLSLIYTNGIAKQATLEFKWIDGGEQVITIASPEFNTKTELLINLINQLKDTQNARFNAVLEELRS